MSQSGLFKVGVMAAALLLMAVIMLGVAQTRAEFEGGVAVATSTPEVIATAVPFATSTPVLEGSEVVFQVRGGEDPCRYLYMGNRVGTFAGGEVRLTFVAGTHDVAGLTATGEMHLYGDTGPHDFEVRDGGDRQVLAVHVGRGETVKATAVFAEPGLYRLFESTMPVHVSEIFARPVGQPGYVPKTGWCG